MEYEDIRPGAPLAQRALWKSEDHREGEMSHVEKRKPDYKRR